MRNNLTIPKSSTSHTRRIQDYNVCYIKDNKNLVPAMPSHDLLSPNRGKRHIKPKTFENCVSTNIVIKSATVNTSVINQSSVKVYFMNTHFPLKPLLIWTILKTSVVCAETIGGFKIALQHRDNFHPSLSHCAYTDGSCSVKIQIQNIWTAIIIRIKSERKSLIMKSRPVVLIVCRLDINFSTCEQQTWLLPKYMYIVVTYSIMMYKNELTYHCSLFYRVHAIFLVDAGGVFVLFIFKLLIYTWFVYLFMYMKVLHVNILYYLS